MSLSAAHTGAARSWIIWTQTVWERGLDSLRPILPILICVGAPSAIEPPGVTVADQSETMTCCAVPLAESVTSTAVPALPFSADESAKHLASDLNRTFPVVPVERQTTRY